MSDEEFYNSLKIEDSEDYIKVHVSYPEGNGPAGETLWAKRIGDRYAKICNIPFISTEISLDDIVYLVCPPDELPEVVCVHDRATYKVFVEYEIDNNDEHNFQRYTDLRTFLLKRGIRTEGMYAGVCMIACPLSLPLQVTMELLQSTPHVLKWQTINPNGEELPWNYSRKNYKGPKVSVLP